MFSVATGGATTLQASCFGIDDPNFRVGASVVAGSATRFANEIFAFPVADSELLRNGAFVAVGDMTGG